MGLFSQEKICPKCEYIAYPEPPGGGSLAKDWHLWVVVLLVGLLYFLFGSVFMALVVVVPMYAILRAATKPRLCPNCGE